MWVVALEESEQAEEKEEVFGQKIDINQQIAGIDRYYYYESAEFY